MANTLTISSLTELIYQARDIVAREAVGFIPSVTINSGSEAVSLGGTVKSIVTAQPTLNTSHTPAMTIPAGDDATIGAEEMTIGGVARTNIPIKGEVAKQLMNIGEYGHVVEQLFAQHIRTIVNAIESHTGTVVKNASSRALGTAGTTPFASSHALIPQVNQILTDNGCPNDGQRSLVVSSSAATNLKTLSHIYKVNESGSSDVLNRGVLIDIDGVKIRNSAGVASHTKGTASSSTVSNAGYAIGATSLALTAAGTGTLVTGDVINIAAENNGINYVVINGDTDVSDGGTIVIGKPGLRFAASTATKAITVGANYVANMLFHRSAVELVMRPPAMPEGGDLARDRMTIFDPVSGLVFEVALYPGYGMNMLEFVVYYQAKVWKQEFVATLLG
jgi:hypothetical protein